MALLGNCGQGTGAGEVSMEINAKERRKDRRINSGDSIPLWRPSQMNILLKMAL
jgi:hypothetical protein